MIKSKKLSNALNSRQFLYEKYMSAAQGIESNIGLNPKFKNEKYSDSSIFLSEIKYVDCVNRIIASKKI